MKPPPAELAHGGDWIGRRERQEDHYFLFAEISAEGDPRALCVLADGMGGHAGGEAASRLAVDTFVRIYRSRSDLGSKERLRRALSAANEAIGEEAARDPMLTGMGCTLVAARIKAGRLGWISVGDSPMWRFAGGRLERLNADHSLKTDLEERVRRGEMSAAEAREDPQRHALTSAVTGRPISKIDLRQIALAPGDRILLASDGVETLEPDEIEAVLARVSRQPPSVAVDALLDEVTARRAPHQDNTTVVIIDHPGTPAAVAIPRAATRTASLRLGRMPLAAGGLAAGFAAGLGAGWILFSGEEPSSESAAPPAASSGEFQPPAPAEGTRGPAERPSDREPVQPEAPRGGVEEPRLEGSDSTMDALGEDEEGTGLVDEAIDRTGTQRPASDGVSDTTASNRVDDGAGGAAPDPEAGGASQADGVADPAVDGGGEREQKDPSAIGDTGAGN